MDDDLPPPPYSIHPPSTSTPNLLPGANDLTSFRAVITDSIIPDPTIPPYTHRSRNPNPDLARSGFISAAPYFELRPYDGPPPPSHVQCHHIKLGTQPWTKELAFPEPASVWEACGVDSGDWETFLNHLFPDYHEIIEENDSPRGTTEVASTPLLQDYETGREARAQRAERERDRACSQKGESWFLRRLRTNTVVAQWNTGFFNPRGLAVTIQIEATTTIRSPIPLPSRNPTSVLQKPQPAPKLEDTPLHAAVSRGSKSKVLEALKDGSPIEALSKKAQTALYMAVNRGEKAITQILLDAGANPTTHPLGEHSSLQHAAYHDRKSILRLLVEKCTTLTQLEEATLAGETALYIAVQQHHTGCVEVLAHAGANVNSRPAGKESPLNIAVSASETGMAKLLLSKGADVDERNKDGDTPLGRAVSQGQTKMTKLLLEHGASVWPRTCNGETPLSVAVARANTSMVAMLLEQKEVDIEAPNAKGETALYNAITRGDTSSATLLLQQGANPDAHPPGKDSTLHLVVSNGNKTLTHLLLDRPGVNLETRNQSGETPLFKAVSRGDTSIVALLCAKGANTNTASSKGDSILSQAVSRGDTAIVSILLHHGASPNSSISSTNADPPLYRAVHRGDTSIVSLLLSKGANPEAMSQKGETCLYRAVYRNDIAILSILLGACANPEAISKGNGHGETALEYTAKKGNMAVLAMLKASCGRATRSGKC